MENLNSDGALKTSAFADALFGGNDESATNANAESTQDTSRLREFAPYIAKHIRTFAQNQMSLDDFEGITEESLKSYDVSKLAENIDDSDSQYEAAKLLYADCLISGSDPIEFASKLER
jgi:hypothetical protein